MIDFLVLYRDFGFETGISVSVRHMEALMTYERKTHIIYGYKDDKDMLCFVQHHGSKVIILQAPTFSNETLQALIATNREINLVIHSTISFLQVEEAAFANVQKYLSIEAPNFSMSNPCRYEVVGFRSYAKCDVFYLPNTFNKEIENKQKIYYSRIMRSHLSDVLRVGIFCSYRPFKNIMTQITACNLLQQEMGVPVEVHMFKPKYSNPIYRSVLQLLKNMRIRSVFWKERPNDKLYEVLSNIDIGMQVSYSETFSYIICEHMMMGTPTVSSTTVPFANAVVEFNNAEAIARGIKELCYNQEIYNSNVERAIRQIHAVCEDNNHDALKCLNELVERSEKSDRVD